MNGKLQGYACNDGLKAYQGEYTVYNGEGQVLQTGGFSVGVNENALIADFSNLQAEKYLILELAVGGERYVNHFINEKRAHDFDGYKKFLAVYQEKMLKNK